MAITINRADVAKLAKALIAGADWAEVAYPCGVTLREVAGAVIAYDHAEAIVTSFSSRAAAAAHMDRAKGKACAMLQR